MQSTRAYVPFAVSYSVLAFARATRPRLPVVRGSTLDFILMTLVHAVHGIPAFAQSDSVTLCVLRFVLHLLQRTKGSLRNGRARLLSTA